MTTTPTTRDEVAHLIDQVAGKLIGHTVMKRLESHGLRIVPVELNDKLVDEMRNAPVGGVYRYKNQKWWNAMLSASPFAPTEKEK